MEYVLGSPDGRLPTPTEVTAALIERAHIASRFVTGKLIEWRDAVTGPETAPIPDILVTEEAVGVGAMTTYIGRTPKVTKTDAREGMSGKQVGQARAADGDKRIRGSREQAISHTGRTAGPNRTGDD